MINPSEVTKMLFQIDQIEEQLNGYRVTCDTLRASLATAAALKQLEES